MKTRYKTDENNVYTKLLKKNLIIFTSLDNIIHVYKIEKKFVYIYIVHLFGQFSLSTQNSKKNIKFIHYFHLFTFKYM